MSSPDDFVVTIHALERFEERCRDIAKGKTDREIGEFIHSEVMEAMSDGRHGKVLPIELAPRASADWEQRSSGAFVAWTADKMRGYSLVDDPKEGILVLTVLLGESREYAMRKLKSGQKK